MSDIQELENRIEQFKSMMNRMQYDLNSMESELKKLKSAEQTKSADAVQSAPIQSQQQPSQQAQPQVRPQQVQPQVRPQQVQPQYTQWQPSLQYKEQVSPQQQVRPQPGQEPKKSKLGAEGLLGKSIMGIAASILIFISIILFATLIIPMLTENLKLILMFGVSFIVTAVGLTLWIRRDSTFFLSIGACGVGSIYISLFLTHSYFHMIDKIGLYVLISLWAAGVLYLSTRKQRLFETIGNAGIFISVIFGTVSCSFSHDNSMMIVLIIYFIIGTLAYTLLRIKDRISFLINSLSSILSSIVLIVGCWNIGMYFNAKDLPHSDMYAMLGLLAAFCVSMMLFAMLREKELDILSTLAAFAFCVIHLISIRTMLMCDSKFTSNLTLLILCSNYYIFLELYTRKIREINKDCNIIFYVWKALILITSVFHLRSLDALSEYVGVFMFIIPLLVLGYLTDDKFSKIEALCLYSVLIFSLRMNDIMLLVYVVSVFGIANILWYMYKNQYSSVIKALFYLLFMIGLFLSLYNVFLFADWDFNVIGIILIFLLGGLNLAATKTLYGKNWLTTDDEKLMTVVGYTLNAILMIFGVIVLIFVHKPVEHFFVTVGLIGLALVNSLSLLKTKSTIKSVYVGIKFTILLIIILSSYYVPNYVLSIAAFLLAIAFIIIGFVMNIKSLRLYGLIVSMIFIFKLVMVDITYNNTLGNAASFFISGVLCFVISAMYNLADKKMNKEENEKTEETVSY